MLRAMFATVSPCETIGVDLGVLTVKKHCAAKLHYSCKLPVAKVLGGQLPCHVPEIPWQR